MRCDCVSADKVKIFFHSCNYFSGFFSIIFDKYFQEKL